MLASATDVASALSSELRRPDFDPDAAAAAAHEALWARANRLQRDFALFGGEFLAAQPVEILRGFFGAFFALERPVTSRCISPCIVSYSGDSYLSMSISPRQVWAGFLAGWPGLPANEKHQTALARLSFGISILLEFPPKVALTFVAYLVGFTLEYGPLILRSIFTPVFDPARAGAGREAEGLRERRARAREVYVQGDAAAKREAVEMLREGRGEPSPQLARMAVASQEQDTAE
jgi:lycopene beta-cyclase